MSFPHGETTLTLPDGKVLLVGGKERRSNSDWRSLRSIEVYDIASGTFTHVADMTHRRDRVTLAWVEAVGKVLIGGEFLVVGGWSESRADGSRGTTAPAERFKFVPDGTSTDGKANGSWGFVSAGTTRYDGHDHGAAELPGGRMLIVGGKKVTDGVNSTYPNRAETYTPLVRTTSPA